MPIPKLLLSTLDAVKITDCDKHENQTLSRSTGPPVDFAFISLENKFFWLNEMQELLSSTLDGKNRTKVYIIKSIWVQLVVLWYCFIQLVLTFPAFMKADNDEHDDTCVQLLHISWNCSSFNLKVIHYLFVLILSFHLYPSHLIPWDLPSRICTYFRFVIYVFIWLIW